MTITYGAETLQGSTKGQPPVSVATEIIAVIGCSPVDKEVAPTKGNPLVWKEIVSFDSYKSLYGHEEFWGTGKLDRSVGFVTPKSLKTLLDTFSVTPVLFYNFFDVTKHLTSVTDENVTFVATATGVTQPIANEFACIDTFVIQDVTDTTTYVLDTDYSLARNAITGFVEITRITTGAIGATDTVHVDYDYCDPTKVVDADVTAAISAVDSIITTSGLGFRVLPGWLHAPVYSQTPVSGTDPAVIRAALKTKALALNTVFTTRFVYDIDPTDFAATWPVSPDYTKVTDDKDVTSEHGRAFFPGGTATGMTEQLLSDWFLALHTKEVSDNQFPCVSPSNRVLSDFTPDYALPFPTASNTIRDKGIITVCLDPGDRGWTLWGTWTTYFSGTATDLSKDSTNQNDLWNYLVKGITRDVWINNIDRNFNRVTANEIIDKWNALGGQQVSKGKVLGWKFTFNVADNPDLSAKVVFRLSILGPEPAKKVETIVQVDLAYFASVFG